MFMIKNTFKTIILLTLVFIGFYGCDANIPRADEIVPDTSLSLNKFVVEDQVIVQGLSTTLSWRVTDRQGNFGYVVITPGYGRRNSPEGSITVNPKTSTDFTITVFNAKDEAIKKQSIHVAVVSVDGDLIDDKIVPEICNDQKDNDLDGDIDCADDDCVDNDNCNQPATVYEYEVAPHVASANATKGQEVTIEWASNFDNVFIEYGDSRTSGAGTDSFTFIAKNNSNTLYFTGWAEGSPKYQFTLQFNAANPVVPEPPKFSALVWFQASPSGNLLAGAPYTVSWSVQGEVSAVELLDGDGVVVSRTFNGSFEQIAVGGEGRTHTLVVTDQNNITKEYVQTVVGKTFENGGESIGAVQQMISFGQEGTFALIMADGRILKTMDSGESFSPVSVPSGQATSYFEDRGGNQYITTTDGVYVNGTQINDDTSVPATAIYATSPNMVIVGTTLHVEMNYKTSASECRGRYHAASGYCAHPHTAFDDKKSASDWDETVEQLVVHKFVVNQSNSDQAVILTSAGAWVSIDGGATFPEARKLDGAPINGYIKNSTNAYFWNPTSAWTFNGSRLETYPTGIGGLSTILRVGDVDFVAHNAGVSYKKDGSWYSFDFSNTLVMMAKQQSTRGGKSMGSLGGRDAADFSDRLVGIGVRKLLGIAADGTLYHLEWSDDVAADIVSGFLGGTRGTF